MFKINKESGDYLKQIKNNVPEKIGILENYLNNGSLPKTKNGVTRVVEVGIGGGESIKYLKNNVSKNQNVELLAVDIIPNLVSSLKRETGIESISANIGVIPLKDESVSAINISSVLHEVSSYGFKETKNENIIDGKIALVKTFEELNRILLPNGIVTYRDVLAPVEDLQEIKNVSYFEESWKLFAEWFINDFLEHGLFYKSSDVSVNYEVDKLEIKAPVGLHREFQRHYLMFRDFLRNTKSGEFGLNLIHSDWIEKKKGLKIFTFSIGEDVKEKIDLSNLEVHSSSEGYIYRANSDQFDSMCDDLIKYHFNQIKSNTELGIFFKKLIEKWKEREGSEHYIYGSVKDILKFSCEATKNTNSGSILFPESFKNIEIIPRYYYNRYLKQVIDNPEEDGKQIVVFKKLSRDKVLDFLQKANDSFLVKNYLNQQDINDMFEMLEKERRFLNN